MVFSLIPELSLMHELCVRFFDHTLHYTPIRNLYILFSDGLHLSPLNTFYVPLQSVRTLLMLDTHSSFNDRNLTDVIAFDIIICRHHEHARLLRNCVIYQVTTTTSMRKTPSYYYYVNA